MRCNSTQEIEKMRKPTIQCTKGAHGHVLVKSTKTINDLEKQFLRHPHPKLVLKSTQRTRYHGRHNRWDRLNIQKSKFEFDLSSKNNLVCINSLT